MTSALDKLKSLRLRYKAAKKGYRASQYEILAEAMAEVVRLRTDEDELEKFILHTKVERPDLRSRPRGWITVEAVSFVTYSRKLAWKAARALEFLHDFKKVSLEKLAEELSEQGGIEKIAKVAAAEDPRRKRPVEADNEEEADDADDEDEDQENEDENNDDEQGENSDADEDEDFDHEEDTKPGLRKRKNDQPRHRKKKKPRPPNAGDDDSAHSEIAVSMSPKLRKKFDAIEVGRRVKLTGTRADKSDWLNVMLEVSKVTLVKR